MRKKVDSRVRILVENAVALRQRAFFVMVGDRGKDQVVSLHYMLSKITTAKPSVLWCYKKELGFSSHRKKRMKQLKKKIQKGLFDPNIDDPFELFVSSTRIRYCYYKETDSILGQTFGMCVLQDFEALTPNILCRTLETVQGGGIICILLKTLSSLRQLYDVTMDAHNRLKATFVPGQELSFKIEPRFNERFILSLSDCNNCLVIDDELNILPISRNAQNIVPIENNNIDLIKQIEIKKPQNSRQFELIGNSGNVELSQVKQTLQGTSPAGPLVDLSVTLDQAKILLSFMEVISEKNLNTTLSLTAARGRGKSATLGLAVAAAVAYSYSNIFITAPSPENVGTLFEFAQKGLVSLGYKEHVDFDLIQGEVINNSSTISDENESRGKHLVRINIFRDHRQTIQYISPTDVVYARNAEILIIDEAAAIPLPIVSQLLGNYLVFLSSTVNGYEGTGRALSLKLIRELKESKNNSVKNSSGRTLVEFELKEPIRYSLGDPVEAWLNRLLCLDATIPDPLTSVSFPLPSQCALYEVNRQALFSYHKGSEMFLHRLMSLFVSSHYKNSPNDLLLLSDAPAHHVFVLLPPISEETTQIPDIFAVIQVSIEGAISKEVIRNALAKGFRPSGDLLPWTLSQTFVDEDFGALNGVRIVRIAVHPRLQRLGYGTEAIRQLIRFMENEHGTTTHLAQVDDALKLQWQNKSLTEVNQSDNNQHNDINGNDDINKMNMEDTESVSTTNSHTDDDTMEANTLKTEILRARDAPPLLAPCSDNSFHTHIDYIGTSFGLTLDLFKFYKRLHFLPVYLRHSPNDITGEHSVIMLRAPKGSDWLQGFISDFKNRTTNNLGTVFKHLSISLALSLFSSELRPIPSSEPLLASLSLPPLTHKMINTFFTNHDLLRLERFSQQLLDRSMILDLLPTLASLLFTGRFSNIDISHVQSAVVLALGLQKKSFQDIAKELTLPLNQVYSLFSKVMFKIQSGLKKLQEENIIEEDKNLRRQQLIDSTHLSTNQSESEPNENFVEDKLVLPNDLPSKSFHEELEDGARAVKAKLAEDKKALLKTFENSALKQYSLEEINDVDLHAAVAGRKNIGSVSIHSKRKLSQLGDTTNKGFSIKNKRTKAK